MALPAIFSRRKRQLAAAGREDVYVYDQLPNKLRIQLTQIWDSGLRFSGQTTRSESTLNAIVRMLRKENGVYELSSGRYEEDDRQELYDWFLVEPEFDKCMDLIEICCRMLDTEVRRNRGYYGMADPDEILDETNARFLEAGVGYQYETEIGEIVRIDSQYIHAEAVKPALSLLSGAEFAAANAEFIQAHEHYRRGEREQAVTECCKAFESTLKVIASRRNWTLPPNPTAKVLLDAVFINGLIPEYLSGEFAALRALLESGVPTVRNRSGGHGAGAAPRNIPPHLAAFQLHQTAAAIVLLVEADKALP